MPSYNDGGLQFYLYGDDDAPAPSPARKVHGRVGQDFNTIYNSLAKGEKFEDPYFPATDESIGPETLNGPLSQFTIQWLRPAEIIKHKQKVRKIFQEHMDDLTFLRSVQSEGGTLPASYSTVLKIDEKNETYFKDELKQPPFCDEPIFRGPYNEFGVNQGGVGDCWFLAVLADVAVRPDCINTLIPENNATAGFDKGIFHFRFWCRGKWIDIVVDDRLPCTFWRKGGDFQETAFTKPTSTGGFWAPLLEKAYAKMYGKYDYIALGYPVDAMKDFTGGFIELYVNGKVEENKGKGYPDLDIAVWKARIMEGKEASDLMSVATVKTSPPGKEVPRGPNDPPGDEHLTVDGIVCSHAYTLFDIEDVTKKNDGTIITLVKLRNPWGNSMEWVGAFCDTDNTNWSTVEPDLRNPIDKQGLGEFWMPLDYLILNYMYGLDVCLWSNKYRGNIEGTVDDDGVNCYQSSANFTPDNPGSNIQVENLERKPGYYVNLNPTTGPNESITSSVIINILWDNYYKSGNNPGIPSFGFIVYWANGEQPKDGKDFTPFKEICRSGDYSPGAQRDRHLSVDAPSGTLFIVPYVDDLQGQSEPYHIRIASKGQVYPFHN